ncbi:hypothetical protein GW17_00002448 [Ensete ventricosum]|nr:hypothetical protein GW17_00002448 [Ensete ventricosum]
MALYAYRSGPAESEIGEAVSSSSSWETAMERESGDGEHSAARGEGDVRTRKRHIDRLPIEPVCASSPVISSVRSGSPPECVVVQSSAWEVGCWSGGVRVKREYSNSGRPPTPARRSGRVGPRRDPSEDQVSSWIGPFFIPLRRRGAGAFIVGAIDHSYLMTLPHL